MQEVTDSFAEGMAEGTTGISKDGGADAKPITGAAPETTAAEPEKKGAEP